MPAATGPGAHADVPVAVIPQQGERVTDDSDGTRSIVVGVDGSGASMQALRWSIEEARVRDVPLTAVYVYRSLRDAAPFDAFASIEKEQLDSLERNAARTARTSSTRCSPRAVTPRAWCSNAAWRPDHRPRS